MQVTNSGIETLGKVPSISYPKGVTTFINKVKKSVDCIRSNQNVIQENRSLLLNLLKDTHPEIKMVESIFIHIELLPEKGVNIDGNIYNKNEITLITHELLKGKWKDTKDFIDKLTIISLSLDEAIAISK